MTQDGTQNFTANIVSGSLPPGCSFWSSTYQVTSPVEVVLTYAPTTQGEYSFQVSVTDGLGKTDTRSYNLVIGPPGLFYSIHPPTL